MSLTLHYRRISASVVDVESNALPRIRCSSFDDSICLRTLSSDLPPASPIDRRILRAQFRDRDLRQSQEARIKLTLWPLQSVRCSVKIFSMHHGAYISSYIVSLHPSKTYD